MAKKPKRKSLRPPKQGLPFELMSDIGDEFEGMLLDIDWSEEMDEPFSEVEFPGWVLKVSGTLTRSSGEENDEVEYIKVTESAYVLFYEQVTNDERWIDGQMVEIRLQRISKVKTAQNWKLKVIEWMK